MKSYTIVLAALILSLSACKGDHDNVLDEQNEARREIGGAKENVEKVKAEARDEINRAATKGDVKAVEEAKIDATKDIAKAEAKVENEKIEATDEVAEAKKDAGETTGTYERR